MRVLMGGGSRCPKEKHMQPVPLNRRGTRGCADAARP